MLIGELSRKTGLSKDTVRFYEKIGLIDSTTRQAGSRMYREYSPEMVERLLMIVQGKQLGFALGEIKQLLNEWSDGVISKQDQIKIVERKLEEIAGKMQALETIKSHLVAKLNKLHQEE